MTPLPPATRDAQPSSIDWNRYAPAYREVVERSEPHRRLVRRLITLAEPTAGARLVDAGCGAGAVLAAAQAHEAHSAGLELNPAFAALARQRLGSGVVIYEHDVCHTWPDAIAPGSVDIVTACNLLYALDDPDRFFVEAARALRPGGRLVFTTPHTRDPEAITGEQARWIADAAPPEERARWQGLVDGGQVALVGAINQRIAENTTLHFLDTAAWDARLARTGFCLTHAHDDAYAGVNVLIRAERRADIPDP